MTQKRLASLVSRFCVFTILPIAFCLERDLHQSHKLWVRLYSVFKSVCIQADAMPKGMRAGHRLSDRLLGRGSGKGVVAMETVERWEQRYARGLIEAKRENWKCWLSCHEHLQKLAYDCYSNRINKNSDQR